MVRNKHQEDSNPGSDPGFTLISLSVGCVPPDWKRANVVPIFKKGDNEDVCNYSGISLLSLIPKIAERVVLGRFLNFFADKIYPMQHGFVKGRSTITQLLDTVHQIVRTIDQGEQTDVAFLDFSKAFDSVSHAHLIRKLDQSGIKGPLRYRYVTLVRSHLEYASEIWSPKSVTMIKRIEGVQRRATKLMLPNLSYIMSV